MVDDDADVRDAWPTSCRRGVRRDRRGSGREALQQLQDDRSEPDPAGHDDAGHGRLELPEELKKSPELAAIPIVILSAHGNVRDAALALGASDYLRKPLRAGSLLEIAERYCRPVFLN